MGQAPPGSEACPSQASVNVVFVVLTSKHEIEHPTTSARLTVTLLPVLVLRRVPRRFLQDNTLYASLSIREWVCKATSVKLLLDNISPFCLPPALFRAAAACGFSGHGYGTLSTQIYVDLAVVVQNRAAIDTDSSFTFLLSHRGLPRVAVLVLLQLHVFAVRPVHKADGAGSMSLNVPLWGLWSDWLAGGGTPLDDPFQVCAPLNERSLEGGTLKSWSLSSVYTYKPLVWFVEFVRWWYLWHGRVDMHQRRALAGVVADLAWMNIHLCTVVRKTVEGFAEGCTLTAPHVHPGCPEVMISSRAETCRHCDVNSEQAVSGWLDRVRPLLNNCKLGHFMRVVLRAGFSSEPLQVAQAKLKRYDPAVVHWDLECDGPARPTFTRSTAPAVVDHTLLKGLAVKRWTAVHRNVADVPRPCFTKLSDCATFLSQHDLESRMDIQRYQNAARHLPTLCRPLVTSGGFAQVCSDRRLWRSSTLYREFTRAVHKVYISVEKSTAGGVSARVRYAKSVARAYAGVEACDVLSYLYQTDMRRALARVDTQVPASVRRDELGGSLHAKVDPVLSLFSVMFDVDMTYRTPADAPSLCDLYVISRALYTAVMKLVGALRIASDEGESDAGQHAGLAAIMQGSAQSELNAYLTSHRDVRGTRLFAYMSDSQPVPCTGRRSLVEPACAHRASRKPLSLSREVCAEEDRLIRDLMGLQRTRSLRVVVQLPPNVCFESAEAFLSYEETLFGFLRADERLRPLIGRLGKGAKLEQLVDMAVFRGQCRLPHSGKANGSETFDPLVVVPTLAHGSDAELMREACLRNHLDPTVGLMHKDTSPASYSQEALGKGMVIKQRGSPGVSVSTFLHMCAEGGGDTPIPTVDEIDMHTWESRHMSVRFRRCVDVILGRWGACHPHLHTVVPEDVFRCDQDHVLKALNMVVKPCLMEVLLAASQFPSASTLPTDKRPRPFSQVAQQYIQPGFIHRLPDSSDLSFHGVSVDFPISPPAFGIGRGNPGRPTWRPCVYYEHSTQSDCMLRLRCSLPPSVTVADLERYLEGKGCRVNGDGPGDAHSCPYQEIPHVDPDDSDTLVSEDGSVGPSGSQCAPIQIEELGDAPLVFSLIYFCFHNRCGSVWRSIKRFSVS